MKKTLMLAVGFLMLLCPCLQAGEIERIKEKGEIIVSVNKGYLPFCIDVKGELTGLDVDLAKMIAQYLGVKVKFLIPESFGDQIPKLLAGQSDIIIAAMTRTVERGLVVNFTEPYYELSQAALVRRELVKAEDESYFDLVGIKGIRIGLREKTTQEILARELFPPQAIKTYPGNLEAVDGLLKGEVDATVHDCPFVQVWASSHLDLSLKIKALLAPVTKESYGFAIRKGDLEFLAWLNLFIAQIQADGTMDLLKYRYFVEMPWSGLKPAKEAEMTKAQLMRNNFVARKQERLETMRKEEPAKVLFPQ